MVSSVSRFLNVKGGIKIKLQPVFLSYFVTILIFSFLSRLCVFVCLSVSVHTINFEPLKLVTSFSLYNIKVKFEYQGYWIDVKVK